jgi:hypothetical protein
MTVIKLWVFKLGSLAWQSSCSVFLIIIPFAFVLVSPVFKASYPWLAVHFSHLHTSPSLPASVAVFAWSAIKTVVFVRSLQGGSAPLYFPSRPASLCLRTPSSLHTRPTVCLPLGRLAYVWPIELSCHFYVVAIFLRIQIRYFLVCWLSVLVLFWGASMSLFVTMFLFWRLSISRADGWSMALCPSDR